MFPNTFGMMLNVEFSKFVCNPKYPPLNNKKVIEIFKILTIRYAAHFFLCGKDTQFKFHLSTI